VKQERAGPSGAARFALCAAVDLRMINRVPDRAMRRWSGHRGGKGMAQGSQDGIDFARLTEVPAAAIAAHMSHPRMAAHMPLLTAPWALADVARFVAAKEDRWASDGLVRWAVLKDGRYAGWGGFERLDDAWDFGLVLVPEHFGLGPPVMRKALAFARSDPRISRVTFLLPPSRRKLGALERLGAVFEAKVAHDGAQLLKFRLDTS
jgi:RimJ/RimL family protein N-acetyltransferase